MTFEQYWSIIMKQWKVIVICFLVVGAGAFGASKLMSPLYQSAVFVQVTIHSTSSQSSYDSLLASDQLVQTEAQLAGSNLVLREVASHYAGLTVEQLSKEVSATSKIDTQLFEIDVLDRSPERSAFLANDIAATLIKQQVQATQQDSLSSQQQIQQDLQLTEQQILTTTDRLAALQAQTGSATQIASLQASLTDLREHYSQMQAALAQLKLAEAQNVSFLRVAQPAQPPLTPVRPNILLNTGAGLVLGLLLGMLLAVLFEQLDTRVRTPEALTHLLDWPILSTIWRVNSAHGEKVVNPTGRNSNAESYRILRTSIGFAALDKPQRSFAVTSAIARDGKSTVASNLAIFMAKAGKTTLLIDADLRRPSQRELFGLSTDKMGLSNAVLVCSRLKIPETPPLVLTMTDMPATSSVEISKPSISTAQSDSRLHRATLQPAGGVTATNFSLDPFVHSVGLPNLWVMPSGPLPPNPPELLDSKAMGYLLTAIANSGFEVAIFDTPPLLGLSDASILVSKVDGTLVVVDATRANKKNLKQAKALLLQAGAPILGCVLNKQRRNRRDTSYYSYYYLAEEQNNKGSKSRGNGKFPAVPETPSVPENMFYTAKLDSSEREKGGPYENDGWSSSR